MAGVFDDTRSSVGLFSIEGRLNTTRNITPWGLTGIPTKRSSLNINDTIAIVAEDLAWADHFNLRMLDSMNEEAERRVILNQSIADSPLVFTRQIPRAISILINDDIWDFIDGVATAEETATRLQNSVTLALMEQE